MSGRFRWAVSVALAVAVVAGGLTLERGLGPRALGGGPSSGEVSGAWFCPHGGGRGRQAWVSVANPTERDAEVRVRTHLGRDPGVSRRHLVPAGRLVWLEVPADDPAAATSVEFFRAAVAVGMTLAGDGGAGVGGEPCSIRAGRRWQLTDGSTLRGEGATIVVVNPFASEAVFDVTLATGDRDVRPGGLRGIVLGPHRSMSASLNRYALGEEAVAATVDVSLGKVVAASVGASPASVRLAMGAAAAAPRWTLPGVRYATSRVTVMAAGAASVPYQVRAQTAGDQTVLVEEASVAPARVVVEEVSRPNASVDVESAGAGSLVVARRFAIKAGMDDAAMGGMSRPGRDWVALPPLTPAGGRALLALANPEAEPVSVALTVLPAGGEAPPAEIPPVDVPPGRLVTVDLAAVAGERPVAVLARATGGRIVVAQAGLTDRGFALAAGSSLDSFSPIGVPGIMSGR